MDKYLYLHFVGQSGNAFKYKWLDYSIYHYPWLESHMWAIFGVGIFRKLSDLDTKLEELWQKHQSKSEVEA